MSDSYYTKSVEAFVASLNGRNLPHITDQALALLLERELRRENAMDPMQSENEVVNRAYAAGCGIFELVLEYGCKVGMNGHHVAQGFAEAMRLCHVAHTHPFDDYPRVCVRMVHDERVVTSVTDKQWRFVTATRGDLYDVFAGDRNAGNMLRVGQVPGVTMRDALLPIMQAMPGAFEAFVFRVRREISGHKAAQPLEAQTFAMGIVAVESGEVPQIREALAAWCKRSDANYAAQT